MIRRHSFDVQRAAERFQEAIDDLPTFINCAKRDVKNLSLLVTIALDAFKCGVASGRDMRDFIFTVLVAAHANAAMFGMLGKDEVVVSLDGGAPVALSGKIDESTVFPDRWLQGAWLAFLCGDAKCIELLCSIRADVLCQSSTKDPEYRLLLVDAVMGVAKGEWNVTGKLVETLKATDPARIDIGSPEYTLNIDVPIIQLLFYVCSRSSKEFEAAIVEAIELHKKYWKRGGRRNIWDGYVSLPLLGLCALARDREMEVPVKSEYIPESVYLHWRNTGVGRVPWVSNG